MQHALEIECMQRAAGNALALHACSGQAAALAGGTTMEIDFALPINGDIMAGYKLYREKAAKSVMDYGFHMAVTKWNDQVGNAPTLSRASSCTLFLAAQVLKCSGLPESLPGASLVA